MLFKNKKINNTICCITHTQHSESQTPKQQAIYGHYDNLQNDDLVCKEENTWGVTLKEK